MHEDDSCSVDDISWLGNELWLKSNAIPLV